MKKVMAEESYEINLDEPFASRSENRRSENNCNPGLMQVGAKYLMSAQSCIYAQVKGAD
jgi:hypothetical protein